MPKCLFFSQEIRHTIVRPQEVLRKKHPAKYRYWKPTFLHSILAGLNISNINYFQPASFVCLTKCIEMSFLILSTLWGNSFVFIFCPNQEIIYLILFYYYLFMFQLICWIYLKFSSVQLTLSDHQYTFS